MPLDFTLAPKDYDAVDVAVTAEQIEQYARASGDPSPRYAAGDGQVASPVFPVVAGFRLMGVISSDPELGVDNPLMIVHGEQEFIYHRPLTAGTYTMHPRLERVEDKGSGAIYVTGVRARDDDGPVVDQFATIFVRGAGSGAARNGDRRPEPPPRRDQAGAFTSHVAVEMPARYAEASGDHNPIHLDPDVAAAVGLPGVINHGMGTLSLVAGGLVDAIADGDPTALTRLQVRFTDMVIPGSDLTTTVWSSDPGFVFETTRPDGAVVMVGTVAT